MAVMYPNNGKVVDSMPIGIGADGSAFDPGTNNVLAQFLSADERARSLRSSFRILVAAE
jgi:hypothetical protein